jgi:hypothetical protein
MAFEACVSKEIAGFWRANQGAKLRTLTMSHDGNEELSRPTKEITENRRNSRKMTR